MDRTASIAYRPMAEELSLIINVYLPLHRGREMLARSAAEYMYIIFTERLSLFMFAWRLQVHYFMILHKSSLF